MRTHPPRPELILVVACLLAILLFFFGLSVANLHFWARYLLPIIVVFLWGRRRDIYVVTALASALVAVTYLFGDARTVVDLLVNHLLPILILWGFAWLLVQRRQLQDELEAERRRLLDQRQQLAAEVAARTADLATSERRYRLLAENATDLIWAVDMNGSFIYVSPSAQHLRGVSREEEQGASWFDRMPPETAARAAASLQADLAALRAGQPIDGTPRPAPAYRKDGSIVWSETIMSALYDEDGKPLGLCGTTRDITARHQAEEALAASERKYRDLYDNSPDMYYVGNVSNETIVDCNQTLAHTLGYTREELIGRPAAILFEPGAYTSALAIRSEFLAAGKFENFEAQLHCKDGTLLDVLISATAESEPFDGQQLVRVTSRNITERKRAEARLHDANQRLQLATDAAGIGIWSWNFADGSLVWDERMCELHAVTPEERRAGISYDLWRARVYPDDLPFADPAQGDPTRVHDQWSAVFRIVLPGGGVRHVQGRALSEYDATGRPYRLVGINRDISDQVAYEQLLQNTNAVLEQRVAERTADLQSALTNLRRANQLKDEFMAMISHELRTPLTGVLSLSELLVDELAGPLNARQSTYVRGITTSGERLLAVINGILGYTHLLSGMVQLDPAPCELASLLTICAASQQYKAAAKGQSLTVQVEPLDLAITADATAIAEVLKRLLDNAVKFTPDGGKIGLAAHPGTATGTVDLVVWDTGIGIPADRIDHVFHAFTQADARLARSHEGIGLGLAYADEMVSLMGGTITVTSAPGIGSRFTVTLPAS